MDLRRFCMVAAWLAAGAATTFGQSPPPRSPYAAVSGVVLNDSTGAPLRRAMVMLSTLDTPPLQALTYSESNGVFGFTMIPPGKYQLHVDIDGFQHARFGASTPDRPPGTLALQAGDVRYGITFRLRPLGSISGTVLDADGDPVARAGIRLLRASYERRRPTYRNSGWAMTDDLGHYRVTEVTPGRYAIMASIRGQSAELITPEVSAAHPPEQRVYAAQFYPDAAQLSAAAILEVGPGKDLENIDFHLAARAVAPLRGKVVPPEEMPEGTNIQINLFAGDGDEQVSGSMAIAPEYNFQIDNLIAGPYVVVAWVSTPEHEYRAVQHVEVPSAGINITLHLERGIDLTGRVDLQGDGERPSEPFQVNLSSGDSPRIWKQPRAEVKPDGTFVIPNVVPGIWDIDVRPIPKGGFIKSMRLGDEDVLTEDMVITSGTREPLRIVVSTRGAVVSGTVRVPDGVQRSPRAAVLLAPSGKFEPVLSFYMETGSDDSGHFEFKAVTPGHYKLYAFEALEPPSYGDPNFLKPFEKSSEAFDVAEGSKVTRDVQLIPEESRPAQEN